MQITQLHIRDFRGIRELDICFEPDITVVIGRNGAGKTSILDALAALMRALRASSRRSILGMREPLSRQNVRIGAKTLELELAVAFGDSAQLPVNQASVSLTTDGSEKNPAISGDSRFQTLWDEAPSPPRIVYYRQRGGFEPEVRFRSNDLDDVFDPECVQDLSLLKNPWAIEDLETWWDHHDAQEARTVRDTGDSRYRDPHLEDIRSLITKVDGFSGISFKGASIPRGLHLLKNDGTAVHVSSLSSGERSYVIVLADLARRLQVFAPDTPLEEIKAIVLIDEVELNLHPAWQSQILTTLTSVFQACQFIVTTHSPQVLSGVENRHVRIIEVNSSGYTEVAAPLSTRGRTSNYLLEGVLRTPKRDPRVARLIDQFNRAIDDGDRVTAYERLGEIKDVIGDTPPSVKVLTKRLKNLNREP